jgi:hypothetical protein
MSSTDTKNKIAADGTAVRRWKLSLDGWAVLLAFAAAVAVRLGVLKHIPW